MHGGWHDLVHAAAAAVLVVGGTATLALAWRGRSMPVMARVGGRTTPAPLPRRPAVAVLLLGLLVLTTAAGLRAAGGTVGTVPEPDAHHGHVSAP
ncbi:MAG TPA: hypothetical protein VH723_09495 [Candidatus Limnocylindrales bacterium]